MSDQHEAAAGGRAGRELAETEDAFDKLRAAMIAEWASTRVDQTDTREKLFLAVQTLDAVRAALIKMVDAGEAANARLELAAQRLTAR